MITTYSADNPYTHFTPESRVWEAAQKNGKAAASWVFDGNSTDEAYRRILKGIQDGDPMIMESFRTPDLSGEFSDDYSEGDLMEDAGWVPHDGTDLRDDLASQYLNEVSSAFWAEVERVAIHHVGCEMDGYNDDQLHDTEHYWHCENVSVMTNAEGLKVCKEHVDEDEDGD